MTVERIIETLNNQAELYEQLLAAEEEKTQALVHNQVDRLNVIVQKERKWVRQAEELEQSRQQATASYFAEQGMQGFQGKISDLARIVRAPEEKKAVLALQERLSELLRRLRIANEQNRQLSQQALDFIHFSVSLMVEDPNEGFTYEHPMNQQGRRSGSGLFNARI